MLNILVSACLLGENCKYNGGNNFCQEVFDLQKEHNLIKICPEVMGGLPVPRNPVEIVNGKPTDKNGNNYFSEFEKGNKQVLDFLNKYECKCAILKSRSPSCGCGKIYDGTFNGKLICGDGLTTEMLKKYGVKVINEDDLKLGVDVNLLPYGII